jgi:hypothetical protein
MKYSGKNREAELTRSAADQSLLDPGERYYVGAKATRVTNHATSAPALPHPRRPMNEPPGPRRRYQASQEAGDQNDQGAYP